MVRSQRICNCCGCGGDEGGVGDDQSFDGEMKRKEEGKGLYLELELELKEERKGLGLGFFCVNVMGEGVMTSHG